MNFVQRIFSWGTIKYASLTSKEHRTQCFGNWPLTSIAGRRRTRELELAGLYTPSRSSGNWNSRATALLPCHQIWVTMRDQTLHSMICWIPFPIPASDPQWDSHPSAALPYQEAQIFPLGLWVCLIPQAQTCLRLVQDRYSNTNFQDQWRLLDFPGRALKKKPTPAELATFAAAKTELMKLMRVAADAEAFFFPLVWPITL